MTDATPTPPDTRDDGTAQSERPLPSVPPTTAEVEITDKQSDLDVPGGKGLVQDPAIDLRQEKPSLPA